MWPLPAEVAVAMASWDSGFILIDDFVVPGKQDLYGADAAHYNIEVRKLAFFSLDRSTFCQNMVQECSTAVFLFLYRYQRTMWHILSRTQYPYVD